MKFLTKFLGGQILIIMPGNPRGAFCAVVLYHSLSHACLLFGLLSSYLLIVQCIVSFQSLCCLHVTDQSYVILVTSRHNMVKTEQSEITLGHCELEALG